MAHSKSALKRWRQNEAHRERNKTTRTGARTAVKKAHTAIASGADDAQAAIAEASSILDRAKKGNVVHKNAVARHKSRMARQLNKVAAGPVAEEAPKRARKTATKATTKTAAKATKKTAAKKTSTSKAAKS